MSRGEPLSTSPESPYAQACVPGRRDATSADKLIALTLTRTGDAERRTVLPSSGDWRTAMGDVFGIPTNAFSRAERELLWRTAVSQHEARAS